MPAGGAVTRRQVLRGLSGAALALPFLPSLLSPREARAATAPQKRYIHMATPHGAVWLSNMYPNSVSLTAQQFYADRNVKRGDLVPQIFNGTAYLSQVLAGPPSTLTPALAQKLNVIQGLDIPMDLGHNLGGHLGNVAANLVFSYDTQVVAKEPRQTIDQIMAWSPNFYPSLSNVRQRSLVLGSPNPASYGTGPLFGSLSFGYADAQTKTGQIQNVSGASMGTGVMELYALLFGPPPGGSTRKPITDRILADYTRLRNSNRRLSSEDRARLDDHISRVSELNRVLNVIPQCAGASRPTADATFTADFPVDPTQQIQLVQAYNSVLAMALSCGATGLVTMYPEYKYSTYPGDWHNDIAHQANQPDGKVQGILVAATQQFFSSVYLDLASKLDAIDDGNGKTVLDNSLLVWTQECCHYTHYQIGVPVITAGSAGGNLLTGSYIDYRNPQVQAMFLQGAPGPAYTGLLYNQFLATVFNVLGIPKSQWEEPGGGYGVRYLGQNYMALYSASVLANNSDSLPYLTSG